MIITQNSAIALVIIILILWIWFTWDENEHFVIQTPNITIHELISKLPTTPLVPPTNVSRIPVKSLQPTVSIKQQKVPPKPSLLTQFRNIITPQKPVKKAIPKPAQSKTPTSAPLSKQLVKPEQIRKVR